MYAQTRADSALLSPKAWLLGCTCSLLLGCGTIEETRVEVGHRVPIHCGTEPSVPRLVLKPIKPVAVGGEDPHVRFTIRDYENASENNKRIVRQFVSLTAVIEYYRDCIEDFNGTGNPHP